VLTLPALQTWGKFLPGHTAAVGLLDRLLHDCPIIVTNGDSYRVEQARTRGTACEQELITPDEELFSRKARVLVLSGASSPRGRVVSFPSYGLATTSSTYSPTQNRAMLMIASTVTVAFSDPLTARCTVCAVCGEVIAAMSLQRET